MSSVFLRITALFLMMAAGFFLRKTNRVDDKFSKHLSVTLMTIFYPCMIFSSLTSKLSINELSYLWVLPVCAAGLMILGLLVGRLILPFFLKSWTPQEQRTAYFCSLMNNFSFLPLLLVASLWDSRAAALIIFAAFGVEIVVWSVGVETISGNPFKLSSLRKLLNFPLCAIMLAFLFLVLRDYGVITPILTSPARPFLEMVHETMEFVGRATIPASSIVCGIRIANAPLKLTFSSRMFAITAVRLLIIPAIAIGIFFLLPLAPEVRNVLVLIATMPTAMASVVMSEIYDGAPPIAAAAVLSSHIFCLATIPLWLYVTGIV